nr:hypothetical protein [Raoultella terrigena]
MKKMIFLIFFSVSVTAGGKQVVRCFTSGSTNVKFVQMDREGASLGYVKYQKSKVVIPLIYLSETSEENDDDGPDEFTTKWAEDIGGQINGYYTIMSKGARFYRFEYKSKKNVITGFEEDVSAYNAEDDDCRW